MLRLFMESATCHQNGVFGNEVYSSDSEGFGMNPSSNEFRLFNSDEWRSVNHGGRVIILGYGGGGDMVVCHGLKRYSVGENSAESTAYFLGFQEKWRTNFMCGILPEEFWVSLQKTLRRMRRGLSEDKCGDFGVKPSNNSSIHDQPTTYATELTRGYVTSLFGIRNVPPNGVFGNEVYGSDSEGFGINPSSNEFRLCNSDEWRYGNHGGRLIIRGYGGGGDMVVRHGLKRCLDHRIIRSSPILPPLL
ncbi:hypothetical protein Tco_0711469 [Tanacetum coccineum]